MRSYQVPPDINEKEKIIGGIFTLTQFFWLLGGAFVGAGIFLFFYPILGKGSLVPGAIFALSGVPFVFIKIKGLTLMQYILRKRTFKKKKKEISYAKPKYNWETEGMI